MATKKRALITGVTGQDGAYLAQLLLKKNYEVFGTYRRVSSPNYWMLQYLGILDKMKLIPADLVDMSSLSEAIHISDPHEIYNLAAQSFVGASFENPIMTSKVDALAITMLLEIIRHYNPKIKFYQASTSELYGANGKYGNVLNEKTPFYPNSPYAAAKLYSYHTCRIYREAYGLFASNGVLFNHESPLRGLEFITRKVTNAVARIKLGMQSSLDLGNLKAERDWGYAPEYVEGMWRILQQEKPDDFVLATGESHSVEELVQEAFAHADLDWKKYVNIDQRFLRPLEVNCLKGDYKKAKKILGWQPKTKFKELVKIMVKEDIRRWDMYMHHKIFPWDAPSYPEEINFISRSIKL